jgi:hypothetical protein
MRWSDLLWMFAAASLFLPVVTTFASTVETLAVDLLRQNRDPEHGELAGFVVEGFDGALKLLQWPVPAKQPLRAANWLGQLPDRVVGVIHTHPRDLPRPSSQDAAEARRLGLPFYVVSQWSLCVANADGLVSCRRHRATPRPSTDIAAAATAAGGAMSAPN